MGYVVDRIPDFIEKEIQVERIYLCNSKEGPEIYIVNRDKSMAFNIDKDTITFNVQIGCQKNMGYDFIDNIPVLTLEEFLEYCCSDNSLKEKIRKSIQDEKIEFNMLFSYLVDIQEYEEIRRTNVAKTVVKSVKNI